LHRLHAGLRRPRRHDRVAAAPPGHRGPRHARRASRPGGGRMTIADLLIGVIWVAVTAYAVLGGADFGAGVLHLLAPAGLAGRRRRRAITTAMGPVWEANHVCLICVLTGVLTAFPAAFSALGSALLVPATLALLGIVIRGAALAFAGQLTAAHRTRRPLQRDFRLR